MLGTELSSSSQTVPLCLATSAQLSFCQGRPSGGPCSASASPQQRGALSVGETAPSPWLRAAEVSQGPIRGQSPPSSLLTSESFPWPSQLLQTPTQQEKSRVGKAKEKDVLSQMRFVCKVPSWQIGWLLHLDIMGPLIHSIAFSFVTVVTLLPGLLLEGSIIVYIMLVNITWRPGGVFLLSTLLIPSGRCWSITAQSADLTDSFHLL